ncbi:hemerythrin domain-containing protein [Microvirga roseola]|uniref:hemerythrin domain-containing protein n=1 Tax=Microvirga roseola TaxID=2883126 RepID=UPI001E50C84C|nr:hemerythrin domain-containing protein [Microvirga roseola]
MDPWHLIANDHVNIVSLCRDILRAPDGVRSRERLFNQLSDQLRWHMEAEDDSLYDALEDDDRTKRLIDELEDEHEEIEEELGRLAGVRHKGSHEWTQRFEDFSYLLDQHFYREEHELLPLAQQIIGPEDAQDLLHDFAEEKIEEIRESRPGLLGAVPTGLIVVALPGAAVGVVAFTAWRRGSLNDLMVRPPVRRYLSRAPMLNRVTDFFRSGDRGSRRHETDVLKDIAKRTRCPVHDVSSRLQLPIGRTYAIVANLERQGLVRSGYGEGGSHEKMVAITTRGREAVQH